MRVSQSGATEPLKIDGELHLYSAPELRDALAALIESEAAPVVDLSEAESCDLAAMQVLCAAVKTAQAAGKQLTFSVVSPSVSQACDHVGFSL